MGAQFRSAKTEKSALAESFRKTTLERLRSTPAYAFAVDTFANLTFNLPLCMVSQIEIAHMTPAQSMRANTLTTFSLLSTGRLYGKFRDLAYKKTGTTISSSPVRKIAVDTLASNVFGVPLYALQLWLAGATPEQILVNIETTLIISVPAGRLLGMWIDGVRGVSGLSKATKLAENLRK